MNVLSGKWVGAVHEGADGRFHAAIIDGDTGEVRHYAKPLPTVESAWNVIDEQILRLNLAMQRAEGNA